MTVRIFCCRALQRSGGVRYWADYLKANLDRRNVWQLPGLWEGTAEFRGYGSGRKVLRSTEASEEARDRIRFLAEECDLLQVILCRSLR